MNVDDLSWQARTLGGVPPSVVRTLLDQGQVEHLVRAARERGDWHCAEGAVRGLCAEGEFERALALLEPFAEIGWRPAEWLTAEVMIQQGAGGEALALVRPDQARRGDGHACARYAELAVKAGQVDVAIEILAPHLGESWLLSKLVDLTEGQNRDEQVLDLLDQALEGAAGDWCRGGLGRWEVLIGTARVLERAGRGGEAVDLMRAELGRNRQLPLNFPEHYANLLARQGRIEELAELAAREPHVVPRYTQALEETGRAPEAEALLRGRIAAHDGANDRVALMHLLARQGRIDEAVETGRPTYDYYDCWNQIHWALELLAADGRPGQALALLESLTGAWAEGHPDTVRHLRLWLLGEDGRCADGIAEATALGAQEPDEWDTALAALLERDGRPDAAAALLRSSAHRRAPFELADLLARHGRPAEALAAVPSIAEERASTARREREQERAREAAERRQQVGPGEGEDGISAEPPPLDLLQ
ncbi:tetratricopeptide repeat protein [Kitasatospora sp. NPDC059646]|uniref:tetratricopeptide repeat protein n=1 Tax=Kitasatospora sp. NPDC059646 TaxID=3346893 RepID=UPI0036B9F1C7